VSAADQAAPVSDAEASALFASLKSAPALLLAVSGGPDSTALMALAARWRSRLKAGPELIAVTIDHALRPDSAGEARQVGRLARKLGIRHRILRWTDRKPKTGLQEAARHARYRLLSAAARRAGAQHILTGHTLDDQAETVLLRMARGSGLTGLGAMARETPLDERLAGGGPPPRKSSSRTQPRPFLVVRPFLDLPKARLIATLEASGHAFASDPSNRDPRFTRARWRELMPALAREGLDARRLAVLARRLRRAESSLELAVDAATGFASISGWTNGGRVALDAEKFIRLPAEVAIRLLGRAIAHAAGRMPLRLGRLEALYETLAEAGAGPTRRVRRTLGGALITFTSGRLTIDRAPPRSKIARAATRL
jgi:tRNA(Ile)-lysidine synthase